MERHWNIRLQTTAVPDGQQRWDQAYQMLLEWTAVRRPPKLRRNRRSMMRAAIYVVGHANPQKPYSDKELRRH
jgi:hypothetical protein